MNSIVFLLVATTTLVVRGGVWAASSDDGSPRSRRPNILLLTADDLNWDSVGSYGCPVQDITPNIDRLASQGLQFDYGYVNIAICTPSRHIMLTGQHSHQTMTRGFTTPELLPGQFALPDILKAQGGYYLAQVNKLQRGYPWDTSIGEGATGFGRNVTRQGQLARQVIQQAGQKPWFMAYNLNDPHRPFVGSDMEVDRIEPAMRQQFSTPSRLYSPDDIVVPGFLPDLPQVRLEMAQYYNSVRRLDDGVGAVLKALDESGQANDTVVVFLSDNGISNPFAKINVYQASLRVPFIVRYPGIVESGTRDKTNMISAIDLAPTILELAGLNVPDYLAGRSFVPLLLRQDQEERDYIIGYYYRNLKDVQMYPEYAIHRRDWCYIYNPWVDGYTEVVNSDYARGLTLAAMWTAAKSNSSIQRRVHFHKYRVLEELYNLRQDPHSYLNVVDNEENRERVSEMQALLVQWMNDTNHPAIELMKDPYNQQLISEYMEFETCNAIDELEEEMGEELRRKIKRNSACPQQPVFLEAWIFGGLAFVFIIAVILRIVCVHRRSAS